MTLVTFLLKKEPFYLKIKVHNFILFPNKFNSLILLLNVYVALFNSITESLLGLIK